MAGEVQGYGERCAFLRQREEGSSFGSYLFLIQGGLSGSSRRFEGAFTLLRCCFYLLHSKIIFLLLKSGQLKAFGCDRLNKTAEFRPQEQTLGEARRAWVVGTGSRKREA